jgi:hypothetical protein
VIPHTLTSADIPAGHLRLWAPTAGSLDAWLHAPIDPRLPTFDQEMRVHEDPRGQAPVSAWIGLRTFLGPTRPHDVADTLTRFTAQHESLRSCFALEDGGIARRTLAAYELRFEPLDCGELDSEQAYTILAEHFFRVCRPTGRPPFAFATLETEAGAHLYAAFDHVSFDGLSAYNAVGALAALHAEVRRGDPVPSPHPSYADLGDEERKAARTMAADDPRLGIWRGFYAEGRTPAAPLRSGVVRGERYDHVLVSHPIATSEEVDQLTASWRAQGVSSGVLWTALLLKALADPVRTETTVSTMISTHNRPSPAWLGSMGWFAGVAPLPLHLSPTSTVADWVDRCAAAWRPAAAAGALPLPLVARALDVNVEPTLVLSLIDSARIMGHERWSALEGQILLGDVGPSGQIHVWLSLLPDGAYLTTRLPLTDEGLPWIEAGAQRVRELATTALAPSTCSLTYEDVS